MLLLGKYEIIEEAGRGGMGVVYRATDKRLSRVVALKELIVSPTIIGQDKEDIISRFNQEAQTAALLNHPNVVTIFDVGEENGRNFIAMEFLPGKSLKDYLDEGYKYSNEEIVDILIQISSGLEHAHSKGVIHRDIKPDNMKMLEGNTVKITDFGIARIESSTSNLTQDGTMLGTLGYISPEQLHNSKGVDTRADIFSFGAMAYEIFTKKLPFDGGTVGSTILKIMTENPIPPRKIDPEILEPIEKIIMKCLIKDPDKRYQKFREIIEELSLVKLFLKNPGLLAQSSEQARKTSSGSFFESTSNANPNSIRNTPSSPLNFNTSENNNQRTTPIAPVNMNNSAEHRLSSGVKPLAPVNMNNSGEHRVQSSIKPIIPDKSINDSSFQTFKPAEQIKDNKSAYQNMMRNTSSSTAGITQKPSISNFNQQSQNTSLNNNQNAPDDIRVIYLRTIGKNGVAKGQFSSPRGIAYSNAHGVILIADTQNRRVQAFDSLGTWQFLIQDSEMTSPIGVATDSTGKIYVVDSNDCKVRVFTSNGTLITSFGGKGTANGQMKSATGISVNNDKIYVVDNENFRINIFATNGHYSTYMGKYGEKPGEYKNPYSIATDSNKIYILDYGLARIQVIYKDGISRAIFGQRGAMKGQFSIPKGIAVDKFGRIYVADTLNHRVQVFDKTGKWIYSFGNKGSEQGQFIGPEGIATSNDGNIYVLDKGNNRIQVFTYEV